MTWNFAMQAMDQLVNSAAKTRYMSGGQMSCPIVFRGPNGAAARVAAQHSQDYASWYAHVPGLKVIAPYTAADHKGLLKSAIRDPNPVIFLENELVYGATFPVPADADFTVPIGRARVARAGDGVTILAYSRMVQVALAAAETLAAVVMEQAFDWLDAPLKRVTAKDVPLPYAANLERLALPQPDDVVAAAKAVSYRS
jgi:pyruvate dehydrogenase E1 component beta subunit